MRTTAPKTRCVNATNSAAYEKRRSADKVVIKSRRYADTAAILRQVITRSAASATAGIKAQAISMRRPGVERATDRRIARCATPQRHAAAQKKALANVGDNGE